MDLLNQLESTTDEGFVNVVIDTPSGSAVKFKYDAKQHCYRVSRFLPAGAFFPFNFGSIPRTAAADGDALDVLVLIETPLFVGCLVSVKLIGVLKAQQKEGRRTIRNDRLLGAPATPVNPPALDHVDQVGSRRIGEIEHFFISYNVAQRRAFKPIGRGGPREAQRLLRIAQRQYAQEKS